MHRSRKSILAVMSIVTLGCTLCISCIAAPATPSPITVSRGESLQQALQEAPEDGIIYLKEGVWIENLIIDRSISLIGQGATSVIESGNSCSPVIYVSGAAAADIHVRIENLSVSGAYGYGCGTCPEIPAGIVVDGNAVAEIVACAVSANADSGIHLADTAHAVVMDCTIADNDFHGLHTTDASSASVTNSIIRDSYFSGVMLEDASYIRAENNLIERNEDAGMWCASLKLLEGTGNVFRGNGLAVVGNVSESVRTIASAANLQQVSYPHEDFSSLQEAVDAVAPGGEVVLRGGIYWESICVAKELFISAAPGEDVSLHSGNLWVPCISLYGQANLHLSGIGSSQGHVGLLAAANSRLEATGCRFHENEAAGLLVQDAAEVLLRQCDVSWNNQDGIVVADAGDVTLEECTLADQYGDGIVLHNESAASLRQCTIRWNSNGIATDGAVVVEVNGCTISENSGFGVLAEGDAPVFLGRDNVIAGNWFDIGESVSRSLILPSREPSEQEIVYPNPAYGKLQDAVDALFAGGRLLLEAGAYEANLLIWRELTIAPAGDAAVEIAAANSNLPMIDLIENAELHLSDMALSGGSDGIRASDSSQLVAANVALAASTGSAICLKDAANAYLSNCALSDNGTGISLSGTSSAELTDCIIRFNSHAGLTVSPKASVSGFGTILYANALSIEGATSAELAIQTVTESAAMLFPNLMFPTLQEAIDAIPAGGEIVLQEGTYDVNVNIDKEVTLRAHRGRAATLRSTGGDAPILSLKSGADLSLIDLAISDGGEGIRAEEDAAVVLLRCRFSELEKAITAFNSAVLMAGECEIEDNEAGVEISDHSRLTLLSSTIQKTNGDGLTLRGESTAEVSSCRISDNVTGVTSDNSYYNLITLLRLNGCGIRTYDSAHLSVDHSLLEGNGQGLHARGQSVVNVESTTFTDTDVDGVSAWGSAHITLVECAIENCGATGDGVYLEDDSAAEVVRCSIGRNGASAVHATDGSRATIHDCEFFENTNGSLFLQQESFIAALDTTLQDHPTFAVMLQDSSSIEMSNCSIAESLYGLYSQDSSGGMLCGNELRDITAAAVFSSSDRMLEGTGNTFLRTGVELKGNVAGRLRTPLVSPVYSELVYPDPAFDSLQAALDGLLPGGTLRIRAGEYVEALTLAKEVSIEACAGHIVTLASTSDDVPVLSLVPGGAVSMSSIGLDGGAEGIYAHTAELELTHCTISDSYAQGIVLTGKSLLSMEDSAIHHCGEEALALTDEATASLNRCFLYESNTGISSRDSSQVDANYCSISRHSNCAVGAVGDSVVTVTGSLLLQNASGVVATDNAAVDLYGNSIADSAGTAIFSLSSQPVTGSKNLLLRNGGDLFGPLDPELRLELQPQTEHEILYPSDRYQSIQQAIDALLPGGVLLLQSGSYDESVTIFKKMRIAPAVEGSTVELRGDGSSLAILSLIPGADLELSNIAMTGGDIAAWATANARLEMDACKISDFNRGGVMLVNEAQASIQDCVFDAAGKTPIFLDNQAQATLSGCVLQGAAENAIRMKGDANASIANTSILESKASGVTLEGAASAVFETCVIRNCKSGVGLAGQADVTLRHCTLAENLENAAYQSDASMSVWVDCALVDNGHDGIRLSADSTLTMSESAVTGNLLNGLYLLGQSGATLTDSSIKGNLHGMELADSASAHVEDSEICDNRYSGIDATSTAHVAALRCQLAGNTLGFRLLDSATAKIDVCSVTGNSTGVLCLDESQGDFRFSSIVRNRYDGIALWGDATISLEFSTLQENVRNDLSICSVSTPLPEDAESAHVVKACGSNQQYPQAPSAEVLATKESVVHVDVKGYEPGNDKLLWFDANGVVIDAGAVLTCWHLFSGEEDRKQVIEIDTLLVEDPDGPSEFMSTADLTGMLLQVTYDLATLLTDQGLPTALPVVNEALPPQDIVWYVGNLDGTWHIIPGILTFPERSCIEKLLPYASRDGTLDDPRLFPRRLLPDAYATLRDETQSGLSGGAVVTASGQLIGILGPKPCLVDRTMGIWAARRAHDAEVAEP